MLKRFTGGGTVVVGPDTLLASWIIRGQSQTNLNPIGKQALNLSGEGEGGGEGKGKGKARFDPRLDPRAIMAWSQELYRPMIASVVGHEQAALFAARENDYVLGDYKFGGNAQAITRGDFVHHTSFLWDWEASDMELLSHPSKQPEYRRHRPHSAFLTPLRQHAEVHAHSAHAHASDDLKEHFWTSMHRAAQRLFTVEQVRRISESKLFILCLLLYSIIRTLYCLFGSNESFLLLCSCHCAHGALDNENSCYGS